MSGCKFWVDGRTGIVHRCAEPWEDPDIARLRKKREAKKRKEHNNQKQARMRNRNE